MPSKYHYGVILDAGSSGTRVHVYRWLKTAVARAVATAEELQQLPALKTKNKKWTEKVHTGISTFASNADRVGEDHLKELLNFAMDVVPSSEVAETPIFLQATAGMRLLEDRDRDAILAEACRYTKENTDFRVGNCDEYFQVIPGDTEGLYGWIAANYLVGGFKNPEEHNRGNANHHTYGFLDMGGASAQIAFAPNSTETEKHADDLKLLRMRTVDGREAEYQVFSTTFLQYGANEARRRYLELAQQSSDSQTPTLLDPCLPKDLNTTLSGTIISASPDEPTTSTTIRGTGNFSTCIKHTYPLLDKEAACLDSPCLFHGVHVPAIDFSTNHFLGVSNFWHGTHEIFEMGYADRSYDFATYQSRVTDFCESDWSDILSKLAEQAWGEKVDEETAVDVCFKAAWIINLLHEGIGVPRAGLETSTSDDTSPEAGTEKMLDSAKQEGYLAPFQAVNKIDDTEVAWVLGKMLLYASSQIPPVTASQLDVGFGSNDPSRPGVLPEDFLHGGSQPDVFTPNFDPADYEDGDNDDESDLAVGVGADAGVDGKSLGQSWKDTLSQTANAATAGRTPGYVLFGVILFVVAVLLCGRQRRENLMRRLTGRSRRSSGPPSPTFGGRRRSKLPFGFSFGRDDGVKYDRLEDGEAGLANPQEFELGSVASSSSSTNTSDNDDVMSSSSGRSGGRRRVPASPLLDVEIGAGSRSSSRRRPMTPMKESLD